MNHMETYLPIIGIGFLFTLAFSIWVLYKTNQLIRKKTTIRAWRLKLFALLQFAHLSILTMSLIHPNTPTGTMVLNALFSILVPSSAILTLQSLLHLFNDEVSDVENIEWSLLGKRIGACKFFCLITRKVVSLTKPALGLEMIRSIHSELAGSYPSLRTLSIDQDGSVTWNSSHAQDSDAGRAIYSFSLFLNSIYRSYGKVLGRDAESRLKDALQPIIEDVQVSPESKDRILSSLFGGLFSEKAATGTALDNLLAGGLNRGTINLLVARPHEARNSFQTSFLVQGILSGERTLYVTSTRPPNQIRENYRELIGKTGDALHIVDCHSFLAGKTEEYKAFENENIIQCPNFELVNYAISEALPESSTRHGRALLDILPSWIMVSKDRSMESIISSIASMAEEFRKKGIVSVFLLDPSLLEKKDQSLLSELVDASIELKERNDQLEIRIPKGAPRNSRRSKVSIQKWTTETISHLVRSGGSKIDFRSRSPRISGGHEAALSSTDAGTKTCQV